MIARIALAIALLIALGSVAEANNLAGHWRADVDGEVLRLELAADGTGSLDGAPGTWRRTKDTITLIGADGTTFSGRVTRDALVFAVEQVRVEFRRAKREPVPPIAGCWQSHTHSRTSSSSSTRVMLGADGSYRWRGHSSYGGLGASVIDEGGTWTFVSPTMIRLTPNGGEPTTYTVQYDRDLLYLNNTRFLTC